MAVVLEVAVGVVVALVAVWVLALVVIFSVLTMPVLVNVVGDFDNVTVVECVDDVIVVECVDDVIVEVGFDEVDVVVCVDDIVVVGDDDDVEMGAPANVALYIKINIKILFYQPINRNQHMQANDDRLRNFRKKRTFRILHPFSSKMNQQTTAKVKSVPGIALFFMLSLLYPIMNIVIKRLQC